MLQFELSFMNLNLGYPFFYLIISIINFELYIDNDKSLI